MKEIYQQTVKDKIQRQNQEFSMEGLRVLAFTYREIPENHTLTMQDGQRAGQYSTLQKRFGTRKK